MDKSVDILSSEEKTALAAITSTDLPEPPYWRLKARLIFAMASAWLLLLLFGRSFALEWLGIDAGADTAAVESMLKLRALSVGVILTFAYLGLRFFREVEKPLAILLLVVTLNFLSDLVLFYSDGLIALNWRVFLSIALRVVTLALGYSFYLEANALPPAPRNIFIAPAKTPARPLS